MENGMYQYIFKTMECKLRGAKVGSDVKLKV
jgi:hypothetical protein